MLQMHPPPDTDAPAWFFQFDLNKSKVVINIILKAYIPLQKPGARFWQSSIFESLPTYVGWAWIGISAAILLMLTSLALIRRPVALAYYVLGSLGLLAFFYIKFSGYLRHHGFLFVCFGTALWIARTMQPVTLPRLLDVAGRCAERAMHVLFPLLLVIHLAAAGIAVAGEYAHVFSSAKAAAKIIRERSLDQFMLFGARDYTVMPIVGYLEKNCAYYSDGGRFGSYVVWDKTREIEHNTWDEAFRFSMQQKTPVVVVVNNEIMNKTPPPYDLYPALQLIGCTASEIVIEESYCIFLLGTESGGAIPSRLHSSEIGISPLPPFQLAGSGYPIF